MFTRPEFEGTAGCELSTVVFEKQFCFWSYDLGRAAPCKGQPRSLIICIFSTHFFFCMLTLRTINPMLMGYSFTSKIRFFPGFNITDVSFCYRPLLPRFRQSANFETLSTHFDRDTLGSIGTSIEATPVSILLLAPLYQRTARAV